MECITWLLQLTRRLRLCLHLFVIGGAPLSRFVRQMRER